MFFEREESSGLERRLYFLEDGKKINYGWYDEHYNQINGFEWHLKDDGTYDKFSVEYVKFEKEDKKDNDNHDEHESDSEDG